MAFAVKPRERYLIGGLVLLLLAAAYSWTRGRGLAPAASPTRSASGPAGDALPRIDLGRLGQTRPRAEAGHRDLFAYGTPPPPPPTPTPPPTPEPSTDPAAFVPTPTPAPRLPPLNLKYIGTVENAKGLRVAVLLTDHNEILTGQPGEVVANRYKIAKIGFESVDLEEVGSGQTRRLPLRGN